MIATLSGKLKMRDLKVPCAAAKSLAAEARGDYCAESSNTTIQYCIDCKIIPTKIRPRHTEAALWKVLNPPFKSWAEKNLLARSQCLLPNRVSARIRSNNFLAR